MQKRYSEQKFAKFENIIPKDNSVVWKNKLQILKKEMIHNDNLQKVVRNDILQKKSWMGREIDKNVQKGFITTIF